MRTVTVVTVLRIVPLVTVKPRDISCNVKFLKQSSGWEVVIGTYVSFFGCKLIQILMKEKTTMVLEAVSYPRWKALSSKMGWPSFF